MAWGLGTGGQLGNGGFVSSNTPVAVSNLTGASAVAAGRDHSLAVQNGAVWAWGSNWQGQLGNGTFGGDYSTPSLISALSNGVNAVAAGDRFSLAVQHGAAKSWGNNIIGQLGNGTSNDSNTPGNVTGLTSGVTAVAAGADHGMAIQNGAVKAWGDNNYGELGVGTSTVLYSFTPVAVVGLTSGVTAIAASARNSLAIQNGSAKAWGDNNGGQLGNGTLVRSMAPITVTGLTAGVTAIASGYLHSLAIQNGDVYAWGWNTLGQLGDGTQVSRTTPVLALDMAINLVAVAAGHSSSYALGADGSLWAWGFNNSGQLGLGDSTDRLTPTQVHAPTGYKFTRIDADSLGFHAVATRSPNPPP